jgi:hypothetical protein
MADRDPVLIGQMKKKYKKMQAIGACGWDAVPLAAER